MSRKSLVRADRITPGIKRIRECNVVVDVDLAGLYQVSVSALNQAVKRHRARFPADFMFQLNAAEVARLRSQIVILDGRGKHRKYAPHAFTEQGVAMLSGVLRSRRAIVVNIEIMRAFVRLRRMMTSHVDLVRKLDALEERYDENFKVVFEAIRELMAPPGSRSRRIGYRQ